MPFDKTATMSPSGSTSAWLREETHTRGAAALVTRVLLLSLIAYFTNVLFQTELLRLQAVLVGAAWFLMTYRASERLTTLHLSLIAIGISVIWGWESRATPFSDFQMFYNASVAIADGNVAPLWTSKSPTTVLYHSIFFWLFGESLLVQYLASTLAWVWGAWFVLRTLLCAGLDPRQSRFIHACVLLAPVHLLYSVVPSSECVFFLASSSSLYAAVRAHRDGRNSWLFASGALLGLAYLTRTSGLLFLLAGVILFAIWPVLLGGKLGDAGRGYAIPLQIRVGGMVAAFLLVVFAYGGSRAAWADGFAFSPSPYSSYNLLAGTNQESCGRYNKADLDLAGFGRLPNTEASANARRIALERINADPEAFFKFAMTKKIKRLWDDQGFAVDWATGRSPDREQLGPKIGETLKVLTDSFFAVSLVGFLLWLLTAFRSPSLWALAVSVPVFGHALLHVFFEVQGRYQLMVFAFIVFGAASFFWCAGDFIVGRYREKFGPAPDG